ncbi:hypothetical protein ACFFRR_008636 [Megaselia abdita]
MDLKSFEHALLTLFFIATVFYLRNFLWILYHGLWIPGPYMGTFNVLKRLRPETLFKIVTDVRGKMKTTYKIFIGPNLWVYLYSPEEARQALNDINLSRPDVFNQLNGLVGDGLLVSKGDKWRSHRKSLMPAFHARVLNDFSETICYHADVFARVVEQNKPIEITERIFLCVLDVICETSMGARISSQTEEKNSYAEAFHEASHLLYLRIINPLLSLDWIYNLTSNSRKLRKAIAKIHRLTTGVISERSQIKSTDEEDKDEINRRRKRALLDTLLHKNNFSLDDVNDEVNTFLFAGVDTTTASMCFILWSLGKHQGKQQRLLEEIKTVLGDKKEITNEDINQMAYLDLYIKECQRLYTIVPLTGRQVHKDTQIGNYLLPKGSVLWINNYAMANDEDYFENPQEFNPERFLDQECCNKYAYLPFGGGLRECIGKRYAVQMMKMLTVKMILDFKITLKNPDEELDLISEMSLKNKSGFNLVFQKRC